MYARRPTSVSAATYDDFVAELFEAETKKECRYAVFDAAFDLPSGQKRSKLVFFFWSVGYILSGISPKETTFDHDWSYSEITIGHFWVC